MLGNQQFQRQARKETTRAPQGEGIGFSSTEVEGEGMTLTLWVIWVATAMVAAIMNVSIWERYGMRIAARSVLATLCGLIAGIICMTLEAK